MPEMITLLKHELFLIGILAVLLIMKVSGKDSGRQVLPVMYLLWIINCVAGWLGNASGTLFGGMYVTDPMLVLEKNILNAGMLLVFLISDSWIRRNEHLSEYFMLMVSVLLGMFFMISSGNLLMFYLSVELSSIPLAALCNWNMRDRKSTEAGMKMIFSSAFASGLMLMGISLLYGAIGSLDFNVISVAPISSAFYIPGFIFFFSGLAFKLSAVPFHFWTADVYEGSPAAVTAFLSVISKGAMVFVFTSVLYHVFRNFAPGWYLLICVISILSMIIGNIFALRQTNLQRFMAFSSIAQIGFILIGISGSSVEGMASSVYFVLIYILSNLAVFAVIAELKQMGIETVEECKGLVKRSPLLAWTLAIGLFSLAGIPPTAGFFGKLFLLKAGASTGNYALVIIAAVNMIVSLYYYLRIVRSAFIEPAVETSGAPIFGISSRIVIMICFAGILIAGFMGVVYDFIYSLSTGV